MFRLLTDRRVLLSSAVVGILAAVALWPKAVAVDLAAVSRGPLVVTIDEEGRTRVRERFVVAAPVAGHLLRIELEPGDRVAAGDIIARIQPEPPALLDARTRADAAARVKAAEASLGQAREEEQRASAALAHAERELVRSRALTDAGVGTEQDLETRQMQASVAAEAAHAAAFAVRAATADVERARSWIVPVATPGGRNSVAVRAPIAGMVLHRLRESEATVAAGEALVALADPRQLEVVADLLSTDAVRVRPGARAFIEQWGGDTSLAARVRRIEPGGFTKVSALGIEEQRVNVVLDLTEPAERCALLGDAYRVEARIVVWEAPNVMKVPTSALFRDGSQWAVYVAADGRARRTRVELGHQTATDAEVTSGLTEGTIVVVHPGDLVHEGARVVARHER